MCEKKQYITRGRSVDEYLSYNTLTPSNCLYLTLEEVDQEKRSVKSVQ